MRIIVDWGLYCGTPFSGNYHNIGLYSEHVQIHVLMGQACRA